jgi:hypothetical protein
MENQRSQKLRRFTSAVKATDDLLPSSCLAPDDQLLDAPVTWLPPLGSHPLKQLRPIHFWLKTF